MSLLKLKSQGGLYFTRHARYQSTDSAYVFPSSLPSNSDHPMIHLGMTRTWLRGSIQKQNTGNFPNESSHDLNRVNNSRLVAKKKQIHHHV